MKRRAYPRITVYVLISVLCWIPTASLGEALAGGGTSAAEGEGHQPLASETAGDWVRKYAGVGMGRDYGQKVEVDTKGNVYVIGAATALDGTFNYLTLSYTSGGADRWTKTYNGPGNSWDAPSAMALNRFANVYSTGTVTGSRYDFDYATLKYTSSGALAWAKQYTGPGAEWDSGLGIAVDGALNVYVTGGSVGADGTFDFATMKYNAKGKQVWTRRYAGSAGLWDRAYAIAVDTAGNVYVTGEAWEGEPAADCVTVKYSP